MASTSRTVFLNSPGARAVARRASGESVRDQAALWGKWIGAASGVIWASAAVVGFERALLVLTLLGFALAVIGFRHAVVGTLGLSMLCTLDPLSRSLLMTGGLWRWNTFNYWLLIVIAVSLPFLLRQRHPTVRILEVFLLLLIVELLFSADRENGMQHVLNVLVLLGLLVYLSRVGANAAVWFWMASVSGVVAGIGGFVFFLQKDTMPHVNENALSFFPLTAVIAVALALALPQKRKARRALVVFAAVNAAWVFLSGSRGSMLIATVCFLFLILRIASGMRRVVWIAAVVALGILAAAIFGSQQSNSVHRFRKLFDPEESLRSRTSGRSELALGAWYIFLEHPLGVGTGAFSPAWAQLGSAPGMEGTYRRGLPAAAHSGWMKVLAENGAPGAGLLIAFVLSFSIVGWSRRRSGVFPLGLLATLALSVAFLADEFQGKGLWFLAAGVLALMQAAQGSGRHRPALARRPGTVAPRRPSRMLEGGSLIEGAGARRSNAMRSGPGPLWTEDSPTRSPVRPSYEPGG